MHNDPAYHNLINESVGKDNVKIIPYTKFETMWAEAYKVKFTEEVVRPIGVSIDKPLSENEDLGLIGFGGDYGDELKGGDILVSRYHNDTLWQDSVKMMEHYNLTADPCKYRGYKGLVELAKKYEAYFILPEQYSKFAAFELMNIGFDGYALGGLAVGETQKEMFSVLDDVKEYLPDNKPHYLMGVGTPSDVLGAVKRGIDMFDCVLPTRSGRTGLALSLIHI